MGNRRWKNLVNFALWPTKVRYTSRAGEIRHREKQGQVWSWCLWSLNSSVSLILQSKVLWKQQLLRKYAAQSHASPVISRSCFLFQQRSKLIWTNCWSISMVNWKLTVLRRERVGGNVVQVSTQQHSISLHLCLSYVIFYGKVKKEAKLMKQLQQDLGCHLSYNASPTAFSTLLGSNSKSC